MTREEACKVAFVERSAPLILAGMYALSAGNVNACRAVGLAGELYDEIRRRYPEANAPTIFEQGVQ